jgi:1-aminocyclopropane-1-carboxylate deaminase
MTPLQLIPQHPGASAGIRLWVKRDDLLHPTVIGNKWRKLHLLLEHLRQHRQPGIITFGGPLSNHLHAVAAAGSAYGWPTVGIVRGTHRDAANPILRFAEAGGMALHHISKKDYEAYTRSGEIPDSVATIFEQYPPDFVRLPEGGRHPLGVLGCEAIGHELRRQADPTRSTIVAIPAGTGTTAAGVLRAWSGEVWVFPAASYGIGFQQISQLAERDIAAQCRIVEAYVFEKFASASPELRHFAADFEATTGIWLDPIYTTKMLFGLFDLLQKNQIPPDSDVIALHTGGVRPDAGF